MLSSGQCHMTKRLTIILVASKPTISRGPNFEPVAERKLRGRLLTEDGNVEISGRNLREGAAGMPFRHTRKREEALCRGPA